LAPIVCFHRDIRISTFSHCRVESSDCVSVRPAGRRVVPPFAAFSEPQSSLRDLGAVLVTVPGTARPLGADRLRAGLISIVPTGLRRCVDDFPGTARPPGADWLRAGLISIVPTGLGSGRRPAGAGGGSARPDDHGDCVFSCQRAASPGQQGRESLWRATATSDNGAEKSPDLR
jgi:hypothetical protein